MAEEHARTEPATPRRRQEARKRGQVARSIEINSALIILTVLLILRLWGYEIFKKLYFLMQFVLINAPIFKVSVDNIHSYFLSLSLYVSKIIFPIFISVFLIGLIANISQVGFLLTLYPLKPSFERINPLTGFSRLFSARSLVELIKSFFKISIVSYVAYSTIKGEINHFIPLMDASIYQSGIFVSLLSFKIGIKIAVVLLILALGDYLYQRYEFERSIRMTRQEVKDEYKQLEGDPLLRSRIRQRQREIARRRMLMEVPRADVVITNPIHIAVALRYDAQMMKAPQVVAKGARLLAEKIKEIAKEHSVPIVENPPVAQVIYKSCEIGQEIPPTLYQAVAEILAFVYSLKNNKRRAASL